MVIYILYVFVLYICKFEEKSKREIQKKRGLHLLDLDEQAVHEGAYLYNDEYFTITI
jgi:hypothetical protein